LFPELVLQLPVITYNAPTPPIMSMTSLTPYPCCDIGSHFISQQISCETDEHPKFVMPLTAYDCFKND